MRKDPIANFERALISFLVACTFVCIPLAASSIKEEILAEKRGIEDATAEQKGGLWCNLANLYLKDQDEEQAINAFLKALECSNSKNTPAFSSADQEVYEQALSIYLDPTQKSSQDSANKIIREFLPYLTQHANSPLGYLVAASYATLGNIDSFFKIFFNSYQIAPEHYLADKMKAILHMKLFEKASSPDQKELEKRNIIGHVSKAIKKYPADNSLYKIQIAFSAPEEKAEVVFNSLNKIIENSMIIPRTDVPFYVSEAIESKQFELARAFLEKVREWYPSSRLLDTAQHYLNKHTQNEREDGEKDFRRL